MALGLVVLYGMHNFDRCISYNLLILPILTVIAVIIIYDRFERLLIRVDPL